MIVDGVANDDFYVSSLGGLMRFEEEAGQGPYRSDVLHTARLETPSKSRKNVTSLEKNEKRQLHCLSRSTLSIFDVHTYV